MIDSLGVVLLTFNSHNVIERTVRAALQLRAPILCVDSGSTDGTPALLQQLGCEVHDRPFKHYADQRNWAIQTLGNRYTWQLHLDADEILDALAMVEIKAALLAQGTQVGFLLRRRTYFLGRELRFGGTSSWHMRLFKSGFGACEDRLYDQHFLCSGPTRKLRGSLHDMNVGSLSEWTARHNRWSDLEVRERRRPPAATSGQLKARLSSDPRQRARTYRGWYYRAPPYLRAWAFFGVRYVVQLGFLDGGPGFLYAFFQALWFRMLIDAKLGEARSTEQPPA
jgi:glycosyltransferase involved in cell wall biosynthesis